MRINVIGLGKAGLPLAAVIADAEIQVVGLDKDKERVKMLKEKKNPIPEEPGLDKILSERIGSNMKVTADYKEAAESSDVHIIIVPLFIDENKKPDFSILDSVSTELGKHLKKGDLVVLETTVPVKTTEKRVKDALEKASGMKAGKDFYLAYSPERIMTGHSISRYREFPKVVGGVDDESTEKAYEVYSKFCNDVQKVRDARTAEMVKISEGIYRDVNIALANELLKICDHAGIDFWDMRRKANHRFCEIHEPGNVGGHCIPVYPWFLINNFDAPLIRRARELNDEMLLYYIKKVKEISSKGKVGVVGLSYREGVKEKAFSRAVPFIEKLKKEGYEVYGADPMYRDEEIKENYGIGPVKDFRDMDVIVIFNRIKEYNTELKGMEDRIVDIKKSMGEDDGK